MQVKTNSDTTPEHVLYFLSEQLTLPKTQNSITGMGFSHSQWDIALTVTFSIRETDLKGVTWKHLVLVNMVISLGFH